MKTSHAVVICLIIFAIFSYTAATLTPLIQQDNNLIAEGKALTHSSLKGSPKRRGRPGPIICGDPIEDPTPESR